MGTASSVFLNAEGEMDARTRALWLAIRQALLIALGATETFLDIQRTRPPKRSKG